LLHYPTFAIGYSLCFLRAARRASRARLNGSRRSRSASIMAIFSPNDRRAISRRPSALRARMSENVRENRLIVFHVLLNRTDSE
jgi:hypothetical protein